MDLACEAENKKYPRNRESHHQAVLPGLQASVNRKLFVAKVERAAREVR